MELEIDWANRWIFGKIKCFQVSTYWRVHGKIIKLEVLLGILSIILFMTNDNEETLVDYGGLINCSKDNENYGRWPH